MNAEVTLGCSADPFIFSLKIIVIVRCESCDCEDERKYTSVRKMIMTEFLSMVEVASAGVSIRHPPYTQPLETATLF